jgi:SAM-dependent methyltransferase
MPDALRGRSEQLRTFVEEAPLERASIVEFVAAQARALAPGAHVLDVGAGDAPYRELFAAQRYTTTDHAQTLHSGRVDIVASADAIPVESGSFDAVLCTQLLEHVPEPLEVIRELRRVLVDGGVLISTVPFAWEEHELPHDYFRYTKQGVEHLLSRGGFGEIDVRPRTDCFTTLAQLVWNAVWAMGSAPDGLDPLRVEARTALVEMSNALALLAPLDVSMILPLGYTVSAKASERLGAP